MKDPLLRPKQKRGSKSGVSSSSFGMPSFGAIPLLTSGFRGLGALGFRVWWFRGLGFRVPDSGF